MGWFLALAGVLVLGAAHLNARTRARKEGRIAAWHELSFESNHGDGHDGDGDGGDGGGGGDGGD